jgi:hypothetical protein
MLCSKAQEDRPSSALPRGHSFAAATTAAAAAVDVLSPLVAPTFRADKADDAACCIIVMTSSQAGRLQSPATTSSPVDGFFTISPLVAEAFECSPD